VGGVRYWYHLKGSVPGGSSDRRSRSSTAGATTFYPQEGFDYQERNGFISNELNLVSTKEGPFQWIAGAYYFHQHYRQPVFTPRIRARRHGRGAAVRRLPHGVARRRRPGPAAACPAGIGRRFDNRPSSATPPTRSTARPATTWRAVHLHRRPALLARPQVRDGAVRLLCFGLPACLAASAGILRRPLDLTGVTTVVAGGTGAVNDEIPKGVNGPTYYTPDGFANRDYDAKLERSHRHGQGGVASRRGYARLCQLQPRLPFGRLQHRHLHGPQLPALLRQGVRRRLRSWA
jgi:hypothetical protein